MTLFEVRSNLERRANGVHNPFEDPTVPLSSVGLNDAFGIKSNSDSGVAMSQDVANQIPTFWRCVQLMQTVVAGCPIRTYRETDKEEQHPKLFLKYNPSMMYTQFQLWGLVVGHICCWGNAFVRKVRAFELPPDTTGFKPPAKLSPAGQVIVDLRPIHPSLVTVKLLDGKKVFRVKRIDKNGKVNESAEPLTLTTHEIMHIPGLGYDGIQGIDPVANAARTLGTSVAADKLAAKFFAKGTMLTGVINVKAPLANQEQADDIRRRWMQKNGGLNATAEVAVLDAETEFQPLTIAPDSLQFLESRRWQTTEIARMFGIPPHLVGDVEKSTSWGTGIEQQNTGFISYTVSWWTNTIEQPCTREIVNTRGQFCEFDLDRLLRGDMQERYQSYGNAIVNGWMNRNEARNKEDMQPGDPELDEFLMPLNMVTVSQAKAMGDAQVKQMQNPQPAPGAQPDDDSDSGSSDDQNEDS